MSESVAAFDVIVVGGGISGLTTAYHLRKRDPSLRVVVFEAKDRVGGRTQTVPLKSGGGSEKWDVGGQWVGRCQPHIMSLLLELGLETHPQYIEGKKVQQLAGPAITTYKGDLPSLSIFALLDLNRLISKVENARKLVSPDDPYACPMAEEWDSITAEHFIQENCYTQGAIDAVEAANRTIFGMESSQVSCLFWFMYISAADGILKLCEAKEFTAQESTIKGGAQQVSELLAGKIGRENVRLGEPVTSIQQDDKGVTVKTAGQSYSATFVVLALPPPLMGMIQFNPPLPEVKRQLCSRMAIGSYLKVIITFQEPEARRRAVLDQVADYFGKAVYSYLDYVEKDWNQEPYSLGGPVCAMPAGTMPIFAKAIRQPFDRLHFAGTETATSWCGYMNGAVQAGLRAAAEVLEKLRPQLLTSEDYGALEGSRPVTRPAHGLSRPRWMLSPRKASHGHGFLKWTIGFCMLVGAVIVLKRNKFFQFLNKF